MTSIVWFRLDLRLADNPALHSAVQGGGGVVPVFIWSPEEEGDWQPGGASRWWLHQSLAALDESLRSCGSRLVIRRGPVLETLRQLVKETGAKKVLWNRRYEPKAVARDKLVREALRADGLLLESFNGALLHEPWTIQNKSGRPFQVFTPYWKNCLQQVDVEVPLPAPKRITAPNEWPKSLVLAELGLEPKIKWAEGIKAAWHPGEQGAAANLKAFLSKTFGDYAESRNRPDITGTSRMSPHLHFGEISARQVWYAVSSHAMARSIKGWRDSVYLTELGWREFAHHLLFHFPHTTNEPLRPEFRRFPWRKDDEWLYAWQRGRTGYPIVDAGMRELWATGWMHNRVRMVVASFLVKDLLLSWQAGARWFWDTLVDADLAQNTLGWQWSAGCGADAAPYFRIFNPVSQGEKFDPQGGYVRKWCPELAKLTDDWLHRPWAAPREEIARSGIVLGRDYPKPVVDHVVARGTAFKAFATLKQAPKRTELD